MCLHVLAVSEHMCCAFANVLMRSLSTIKSTWSTVATSRPLAWLVCGGERRTGSQARNQSVFGQCTQHKINGRKVSASILTELRLVKVDSSLAGTCMSCSP